VLSWKHDLNHSFINRKHLRSHSSPVFIASKRCRKSRALSITGKSESKEQREVYTLYTL
jgi:hypothetical protein